MGRTPLLVFLIFCETRCDSSGTVVVPDGSDATDQGNDAPSILDAAADVADANAGPTPSGRSGNALVYDVARQVVTLYAGVSRTTIDTDVWDFDGAAWTQLHPATLPPMRYDPAFAYDRVRANAVLFGGTGPLALWDDTWLWDGASWTQATPAMSPSPRVSASVTFDPLRGEVLLFGGRDNSGTFFGDTWSWDGATWTPKATTTSPSPRVVHTMAFDAAHGKILLFGGRNDSPQSPMSDTWSWDGQAWTQLSPSASPAGRFDYGMGYDVARQRVILFGGEPRINGVPYGDTWTWDGTTWVELHPAHSPSPRIVHGFVYDEVLQGLVLVSGTDNRQYFDDTWAWMGDDWVRLR